MGATACRPLIRGAGELGGLYHKAERRFFSPLPGERLMASIIDRRVTAQIEGDFVVFLIGMRINKLWKPHKWLPSLGAMPKMLKELEAAAPEYGFLGSMNLGMLSLVQYWRSFDHLEAYARARDKQHWPAWVEFNRRMKDSRGDVGIWHETYLIRAGEYENIYSGMPLMGLARAAQFANVFGDAETARGRLGVVADDVQPALGEKRLNSPV
jgi:hypothetical protein